ncbi:hypothetical protein [Mycoplasmopsis agassizii]|uniref:Uncharacterized protein n=1 Tax=Mycoplasmopsis agassizii TaxID=33922 RepID=A0ABX4H5K1_9BACT|nr:hypothetical protein [Mycoplasmopsis agassizii]PAF55156.1 hypothetical protein CJF60_00520 [Mycoplasmopsis agassizii]SMC16800.1 hypothetical protein SAMN02745179_00327 [Mycoplasmopsis agassizii]
MKKFSLLKKKLLTYTSITVSLVAIATITASTISYKTNDSQSFDLTKKFSKQEIKHLGEISKDNKDILNWISKVDFNKKTFDLIKEELFKINSITEEQKIFMYQNLLTNYSTYKLSIKLDTKTKVTSTESRISRAYESPYGGIVYPFIEYPSTNEEKLYFEDSNGEKVHESGKSSDNWEIYDYAFADDVSYLFLTNQEVLTDYLKSLDEAKVAKIQSDLNEIKTFTSNVNLLMLRMNYSSAVSSQLLVMKSSLSDLSSKINEVLNEDQYLKAIGFNRNKLTEFLQYVNQVNYATNSYLQNENQNDSLTNVTNSINTFQKYVDPFELALRAMVTVSDQILLHIPTPNGYTAFENINDHGLNDFKKQIKDNYSTMMWIEKEWSDNFQHGIVWKVTDGWFTFPDLFIATQEEPYKYKLLSPNDEFNWGHPIPLTIKGDSD